MKSNSYLAIVDVKVAGIPCKAGVIDFMNVQGSYSRNAGSDMDYSGYCEMTWDLLDRKGYLAGKWLTSKITRDIENDIEDEIYNIMA
jgi:hypothetical protein